MRDKILTDAWEKFERECRANNGTPLNEFILRAQRGAYFTGAAQAFFTIAEAAKASDGVATMESIKRELDAVLDEEDAIHAAWKRGLQ